MRKVNGASGKTVSATTRQLESLIRLSEAHAKMRYSRRDGCCCCACVLISSPSTYRLSDEVALEDVQEAIRLVREAMLSNAVDPLTGKIDMDLINTGKSSALRERQADLKRQIKALLAARPSPSLDFGTLHAEMSAQSSIPVNDKWLRDVLEELVEEEFIRVTGNVRRGHCLLYRL
jgi:DNA replication licensing factor MCM4